MTPRGLMAVMLAIVLSGCWVSDEVLFGPEDYAKVDLRGQYKLNMVRYETTEIESHIFEPQPDGSIKSTVTYKTNAEVQRITGKPLQAIAFAFFIAIPDAPEGWYLTGGIGEDGDRDPNYYIVSIDDERVLKIYAPDCRATKPQEGLLRSLVDEERKLFACDFKTKAAVLSAAKDTVDFITQPQPVLVEPWMSLGPVFEWEDDYIGEPAE